MEYYTAMPDNEILSFAARWIDIMINKINENRKKILAVSKTMWKLKNLTRMHLLLITIGSW